MSRQELIEKKLYALKELEKLRAKTIAKYNDDYKSQNEWEITMDILDCEYEIAELKFEIRRLQSW